MPSYYYLVLIYLLAIKYLGVKGRGISGPLRTRFCGDLHITGIQTERLWSGEIQLVGRSVGRSRKLLLVFASTVIFASKPRQTHDHILTFHDSGSCAT
jgi:hypothetical protein